MAESGKYLIGESLREKLKSTIAKVDSIPFGGPVSRIPTIHEGDMGSGNQRRLVMPMKIYGNSTPSSFPEGSVVWYDTRGQEDASRTDEVALGTPLTPPYGGYFEMSTARAYLHEPGGVTPIVSPTTVVPWGVTISGGTLNESIVSVIIRGVAMVRIRSMQYAGNSNHLFVQPSIRRSLQETSAQLRGILETTACGCDGTASILYIDGGTVATSGGSETAQVYWGAVIL